MKSVKTKRIFYFDALRALAIISVIIIHVLMLTKLKIYGDYGTSPSLNWFMTDFMVINFRIGVDLFLMLSGALSLGRVWTIKSFLGKRLPRIISPFLFWGFVLSLLMIAASYVYHFSWIQSFDLMSILDYIYNAYMSHSKGFSQYWFFWMILGTYLIMPIFNKWIYNSKLDELEYFLILWLITCIFDYTLFYSFPIKLNYFVSPIGLVVLGYYLRYTERKLLNNPYFAIFLIIFSSAIMMTLSYMFSTKTDIFVFDRYSIFIAMEVIGVWMLFKNFSKFNIKIKSGIENAFKKSASVLAKYSYGLYLTHVAFMHLADKLIKTPGHYKLHCLVLFAAALFIPLTILVILIRIPYVNQIIGAK